MRCPRTFARMAYAHGWHAFMSEAFAGPPPPHLPQADLAVVTQALGPQYGSHALDGWEAAKQWFGARVDLDDDLSEVHRS